MTQINESLSALAQSISNGIDSDDLSEQLEQESRRYSQRLTEEEEAKLR